VRVVSFLTVDLIVEAPIEDGLLKPNQCPRNLLWDLISTCGARVDLRSVDTNRIEGWVRMMDALCEAFSA
jgi:hypothetical protein